MGRKALRLYLSAATEVMMLVSHIVPIFHIVISVFTCVITEDRADG